MYSAEANPLHLKVVSEVAACIGCNDCMIACPIQESKFVTIAELNGAVRAKEIENPRVADFVTACTQCGRCVPACPADLSRADMVLINKMKVEDAVEDHVLPLDDGVQVVPSPWTLDGLAGEFAKLELFEGVEFKQVRRLLLSGTMRRIGDGTELCQAGEYYERLLFVLQGQLLQFLDRADKSRGRGATMRTALVAYESGAFLGEGSMMAEQPEPFGLMASEETVVFEVPRASVRRLLGESPVFAETMTELYKRRVLFNSEQQPTLTGSAPPAAYRLLMQNAELITYGDGEALFKEGEPLGHLYVVRSGFVKLSRALEGGERVLSYVSEGDLLGSMGLVYRERSSVYSAIAAGRVEVFRVEAEQVFAAMHQFLDLGQALISASGAEEVARSTELAPPRPQAEQGPTHMAPLNAHALVDAGLAKGREVLVIDQTKCTSCESCVDACSRRHGQGRLRLQGLQLDHLLFPTACRHCEDPVCLLCSVNGIVRRPSGEITVISDNCIGCGACAERCPYGNIIMSDEDQKDDSFDVWSFLGFRKKKSAVSASEHAVNRKANKCDLCADYSNYACVNACPTGAAFRTDLSEAVSAKDGGLGLKMRKNDA